MHIPSSVQKGRRGHSLADDSKPPLLTRPDESTDRMSKRGEANTIALASASLSAKAYEVIRDMLTSIIIYPGEPLNEGLLAKQLNMGRTPVREALKRLEAERLVVIYPRRGIFATEVHDIDLGRLSEVRKLLEGEAAYQAATRAFRSDRSELKTLLGEAYNRVPRVTAEIDFDTRVHRAIYRASHNSYLEGTLTQYYNLTIRIWNIWEERLPVMSEHVSELIPLLECVLSRDADEARTIAVAHVAAFQASIDRREA